MKKENGSMRVTMGVKATAESTKGFAMSKGVSQGDRQIFGKEGSGPDMNIDSASLLKAASTNLMTGMSASRGKGK